MQNCIIIPTLNEKGNISKIYYKIKKYSLKTDILFIDDNSADGSRQEIKHLSRRYKNIKYLFRNSKKGIGSAHKEGIKYCYKKKYKTIITMDCDGTHDPKYIKQLIFYSKNYDYISTNRFLNKNLLSDWPFQRLMITKIRHFLISLLLKISFDASGAYRCFETKKIKLSDILSAKNNDYAFFWQITYMLFKKNYSIYEIPVKLPYRKLGKSKMKFHHMYSSLFYLIKLYFYDKK
jgi:dolichol-phosphate mannosyltransferase